MVKKKDFPQRKVSLKKRSNETLNVAQPITKQRDYMVWRDKISFWILGFNNKFGYVVVLTAAKDILHIALPQVVAAEHARDNSLISTGTVLLMLTTPALLIQWLRAPFPKCFESLTTFSMLLGIPGYVLLAFSAYPFLALFGVIFISISYGIGDYELSKQSLFYKIKVGKCFRSGTEDALIGGSLYYAVLRELGVDLSYIFYSLLFLPVLALLCFWFLLRAPVLPKHDELNDSEYSLAIFNPKPTLVLFEDKLEYILYLMKYAVPLGFIILLQSFVNQGLYEFIYFRGNIIDIRSQYRFFICFYNFGVYACLVTKNLLLTRHVWKCTVLQMLLTFFFVADAIFFFTAYLWCILLLTYIEGLITGVAYTSTMERILAKEPANYLDLAESFIKNSLLFVSILAGVLDFGVHFFLSRMPEPSRP